MRSFILVFLALLSITLSATTLTLSARDLASDPSIHAAFAAAFFAQSVSVPELRAAYKQAAIPTTPKTPAEKIRILIVPGHEPDWGGAEYRTLKERNIVPRIARFLTEYLERDGAYEVVITRTEEVWYPLLADFLESKRDAIISFVNEQKTEMDRLIKSGDILTATDDVPHNDAPRDVALRLYGINKWANDTDTDIIIHVHINDYPRRNTRTPGIYTGFSVYIPDRQYSHAMASRELGESIFRRLARSFPPSDLPKEKDGITEDQSLIAIGAHNTLNAAVALVEYGYIYESRFAESPIRDTLLREAAFQTYQGLTDFLAGGAGAPKKADTAILPHTWQKNMRPGGAPSEDVLALQYALMQEGLYPPTDKTVNECPMSGFFGACTRTALVDFQRTQSISGETGFAGAKTLRVLNEIYGSKDLTNGQ